LEASWNETLEQSEADAVVVGEGERSFAHIVRELVKRDGKPSAGLWADVGGACYHGNGGGTVIRQTPPADFIVPLDRIPFPAWDLVDLKSYRGWYLSKQSPQAPVLSARGCPFSCEFCSNAVWKTSRPVWRCRSAANVVDEIEHLHSAYGIKEVFDQADGFNTSLDNALEICREIQRRGLKITWKAQLRARPFNEDLAQAMAAAGCWYVHLGIESGNQEALYGIGKHITLHEVETTCRWLRKHNIKVLALFMLYNAWEQDGKLCFEDSRKTENTLAYASRLAKEGLINYISWSVTMPYPGSRLYDVARRHELIPPVLLHDWEAWQTADVFPIRLPGVDRREQGIVKRKGEWLRANCLLKNGGIQPKDLWFMAKRGLHILSATRNQLH
jgi:radical SAM superfamily enzyme YgiQ (UPF0313 family)